MVEEQLFALNSQLITMFFTNAQTHFFKPLVGKYREHINRCVCLLYQHQYGANADYGHSLNREQVVEIIDLALTQCSDITFTDELSDDSDNEERFKNTREQANWILKQLLNFGWIEKQVDPATHFSTFPFSRMGRLFAKALIDADSTKIKTRHRNTRNTLNALDAYASRGEIDDLLDALAYSEQIITDFTDIISELDEKKRALVQEMESQELVQQAAEQFFEFMEKRFQPDIQIRLSADSVEKHREAISKRLRSIRQKNKEFKASAEGALRRSAPDLCEDHQSYFLFTLDIIERRMHNAADVMLPALRRALHGFTKRADIIIRQLSYLNAEQDNNLLEICQELSELDETEHAKRMRNAANAMAGFNLRLIDPQQIKVNERKIKQAVDDRAFEPDAPSPEAQRELLIEQLLDQAFILNSSGIRDYVVETLRDGRKLSTRELSINDAPSLLAMAHAIEVGTVNNLSSELRFTVTRTGNTVESNPYYHRFDEHEIELIDHDD